MRISFGRRLYPGLNGCPVCHCAPGFGNMVGFVNAGRTVNLYGLAGPRSASEHTTILVGVLLGGIETLGEAGRHGRGKGLPVRLSRSFALPAIGWPRRGLVRPAGDWFGLPTTRGGDALSAIRTGSHTPAIGHPNE